MIAGSLPAHSASCALDDGRKQNFLGADPEEQPARAAELVELAEDEINGLAHPGIGSLLDAFVDCADVTHSNALDEFAPGGLLRQCSLSARPKVCQLHLADLSLHPQQQPVIWIAWILNAISIDQQGPDDAAKLKQRVPVAAVPGQPRRFNAKHRSHKALTQRGE